MGPDYLARVRRGAELLDRARPDWWSRVGSPADLVMWHPRFNILARAFGSHGAGLAALGLDAAAAAHHGFEKYPEEPSFAFGLLAQHWCSEACLRVPPPGRKGVA